MNNTIKRTGFRAIPVALGATAALMLGTFNAPAAFAAPGDDAPSLVVKFDARELESSAGVAALYRRIETAARQVCPEDSERDLSRAAAGRQCRKDAVARAVETINNPRLATLSGARANRG
jgi:UrcA family protein